jgi:hypothetical protein
MLQLFYLINKVLKLKASVFGHIEVVIELLTKNANIEANKALCTPLIGGMVS